jgi:gamma-glutamyltranspeptidase / glutathione hydrolase
MKKQTGFIVLAGLIIIISFGVLSFANRANTVPAVKIVSDSKPETGNHVQAVVSGHELATEAGLKMIEQGGTAADAAVAIAAVLSVVEPWFSSALGGGTWALYYDAQRSEVTSLDGVGPTGSKATVADYSRRAGDPGMHQANVPGAWDGWMLWLERYGNLGLDQVLAPAIEIAREGYPMSREMANWLSRQADVTLARPDSLRVYAPNGTLLREGNTVYQHDMADTFEALANAYLSASGKNHRSGIQAARDYFYRGPIAEAIVEFSDRHNGYLTLEDFNNFRAQIVQPIYIDYNDEIKVFQSPPNSQGITMLLALNILKDYDFSGMDVESADYIHLVAEAIKLAFADRYYHVGDPDRIDVSVSELLSDRHAERQRERINMANAMFWPIADGFEPLDPELAHTTTFHVVDKDGNGAAVTTSLGAQFFVVGDTGIHINHRMRFLALQSGDPNQVTPGYKVRHTSNPYMAFKNGRLYILGGNTGADTQSQGQAQQFLSVAEFGLGAQEAVTRPRFVSTAFPSTVYSYQIRNTLQMEEGFPLSTVQELRARGHNVTLGEGTFGSANMIVLNPDGSNAETGAEPRESTSLGIVLDKKE